MKVTISFIGTQSDKKYYQEEMHEVRIYSDITSFHLFDNGEYRVYKGEDYHSINALHVKSIRIEN